MTKAQQGPEFNGPFATWEAATVRRVRAQGPQEANRKITFQKKVETFLVLTVVQVSSHVG